MKAIRNIVLLLFFLDSACLLSQSMIVCGYVKNLKTGEPVENAAVRLMTDSRGTVTGKKGYFQITVNRQKRITLVVVHPGFYSLSKEVRETEGDTICVSVLLNEKMNLLDSVAVYALSKPETLVGKSNYSIYDYDFYEDKLILLTAGRSPAKAQLKLSDYNGNIITSRTLPEEAGKAVSLFHDFEGYSDLICSDTIYRIELINNDFFLMPISRYTFERSIEPVSDSAGSAIYYSDQWEKYPLFHYYFIRQNDSAGNVLSTVANSGLLDMYNMEYYFLSNRMQLEARKLARYYKTDKRVIAAMMSGFTQSMFYEPLYAPLFVMNDTVCVFNHYTDHIYHFGRNQQLIDSVRIGYHHPKNWREWKRRLYIDKPENKVYAFFSRDGHHYLKHIDHQSGKEIRTYKLKNHSAEKIRIRDGYVYYVYRPFSSTQEKFLYRERID